MLPPNNMPLGRLSQEGCATGARARRARSVTNQISGCTLRAAGGTSAAGYPSGPA